MKVVYLKVSDGIENHYIGPFRCREAAEAAYKADPFCEDRCAPSAIISEVQVNEDGRVTAIREAYAGQQGPLVEDFCLNNDHGEAILSVGDLYLSAGLPRQSALWLYRTV